MNQKKTRSMLLALIAMTIGSTASLTMKTSNIRLFKEMSRL